ncbi:P-loop containing nucleoside triphosphate hydrolase protein [Limtongia smithiae]|uniref:P-loop containing nucleoside triphosphate hydrolase protein n=1 Tax=Limtongia smithiae TaxID=1125753 RepID=UPI0034CD2610
MAVQRREDSSKSRSSRGSRKRSNSGNSRDNNGSRSKENNTKQNTSLLGKDDVNAERTYMKNHVLPLLKSLELPFRVLDANGRPVTDGTTLYNRCIGYPIQTQQSRGSKEIQCAVTIPSKFNLPPVTFVITDRLGARDTTKKEILHTAALHALDSAIPGVTLKDFLPCEKYSNLDCVATNWPEEFLKSDPSAKLDILALCLRYGSLPEFNSRHQKNNQIVSIRWPTRDISVTVSRQSARSAELAACIAFKMLLEKSILERNEEGIFLHDLSELSPGNCAQFIEYVAEEEGQEVVYKPLKEGKSYGGKVLIGESLVGQIRGMHSAEDGKTAAFMVSAYIVRQRDQAAWDRFIKDFRQGHGTILKKLNPVFARFDYNVIGCMRATGKDMDNLIRMYKPGESIAQEIHRENDRNDGVPLRKSLNAVEQAQRNEQLRNYLLEYQTSQKMEEMRKIRSELPLNQKRDEVLALINENDVCIVVGATGSGKSTQVPQIILDDMIMQDRGAECNIVVTQPRRIAASSVAERVAAERNDAIGMGVGYQVRFDSRAPRYNGSINFVTTGTLLRQLHGTSGGVFDNISHVIIDEVHERSLFIDFLLVLLKRMLNEKRADPTKKFPKIILMSATVDTTLFANYFASTTGKCPLISIPGRTFPVEENYLEDVLQYLGKAKVDSIINQSDRQMQRYISTELNCEEIADPALKAAAEDEADKPAIDWTTKGVFGDSGLTMMHPTENSFIPHMVIAELVFKLVAESTEEGSILVFLPGLSDITALQKMLMQGENNLRDESKYRLYVLHSTIQDAQRKVFEKLPSGVRKIILATNIAETSVTIPELRYVIDGGKERESKYIQSQRITTLMVDWASRSNLKQRAGRAGRVSNGVYYGMYSRKRLHHLQLNPTPEILRSDLQDLCLETKAIGIEGQIEDFLSDTIQPPGQIAVRGALESLLHLGALTDEGELTAMGRLLSTLPLAPTMGRMVLFGVLFRCLDPMIIIAAATSGRDLFLSPIGQQDEALEAKRSFAPRDGSDVICSLNAYRAWRAVKLRSGLRAADDFANSMFMHRSALRLVDSTAEQILEILEQRHIIPRTRRSDRYEGEYGSPELNAAAMNVAVLKALIFIGTYPNVALSVSPRALRTDLDNSAIVHPSSVNFPQTEGGSRYRGQLKPESIVRFGTAFSFIEKMKRDGGGTQVQLMQTTKVPQLPLLLFSKSVDPVAADTLLVDRWIPYSMNPPLAKDMVLDLREKLNLIIQRTFNQLAAAESQQIELADTERELMDRVFRGIVYMLEVQEDDLWQQQQQQMISRAR